MHSLENLRGIPRDINGQLHLGSIEDEWRKFREKNDVVKKNKLLYKATEIDDKYGDKFLPPVRN